MKQITAKRLIDSGCCSSGVNTYFKDMNRKAWNIKKLFEFALSNGHYSDIRYGLSRSMTKEQNIEWSIYCAESVLSIFEDKYPSDKRPRNAINAAKKYLSHPTNENKTAAAYAAASAAASAYAAASDAAASDAAYAAYAAASDAAASAYAAAYAAAYASDAAYAAYAAYAAASDAADLKEKLLRKGLKILLS
jgi:hypothetical protein